MAVLLWFSIVLGGAGLAVLAFGVVAVWLARTRRWWTLAVFLGASPFAVASAFALIGYARGTARLQTHGLPDGGLYNVSRETRYQSESSGCIVNGSEWVLELPNNLTLLALNAALGPMPGAYDGPYPERHDIDVALRSSSGLVWGDLERDRVTVGQRVFHLRKGLGASLAPARHGATNDDPREQPSVAIWRDRVLILRLPSLFPELEKAEPLVVVIDGHSGKVIAYEGESFVTRRLPLPWT